MARSSTIARNTIYSFMKKETTDGKYHSESLSRISRLLWHEGGKFLQGDRTRGRCSNPPGISGPAVAVLAEEHPPPLKIPFPGCGVVRHRQQP